MTPIAPSPRSGRGLTGRRVLAMFVAFFGTIAAVNVLLAYLAVRSWSGAETSSAYRAGQIFNAELAQARAQDALGWTFAMAATRDAGGDARLIVEAVDRAGAPLRGLRLHAMLQRPADQREDREADLAETVIGRYEGAAAGVAAGQWDLVVDANADGERIFRRKTRLLLR